MFSTLLVSFSASVISTCTPTRKINASAQVARLQSWTEQSGTANPHPPAPIHGSPDQEWSRTKAKTRQFPILDLAGRGVQIVHLFCPKQNKIEQQTPIPPNQGWNHAKAKTRANFSSLIWGEVGYKFSIYFVQDCSKLKTPGGGRGISFNIVLLFKPHADGFLEWIG